jgi:hypothetical protein
MADVADGRRGADAEPGSRVALTASGSRWG